MLLIRSTVRSYVSLFSCTAMLLAQSAPIASAAALTRTQYDDCAARDEAGLGTALTAISAESLKSGLGNVDYHALVDDAWRRQNLDDVIDNRVDIAVEEVKNETSWGELLKSITSSEASQKLATAVAERVYRSDAVKEALDQLAIDVSKSVGGAIETAGAQSSNTVLACLKAFIGPRYGTAVAESVSGDAGKDLALDPQKGSGEPTAGAVLKQSGGGIAGATILIVRRQLAKIAARVGQRIVGSVLSRLVSVAAGGIGLVLIAKDIWEFRNGVLPIIATEMKSKETKEKVREEIATTIAAQIGEHVQEIAAASSEHIVGIWKEFKRVHAIVLRLAESDGAFRSFLDGVAPDKMARLGEIVGLIVTEEGEASIKTRLGNGSLNEAVHIMPDEAVTIARETRSVAKSLGWSAVAGDRIGVILEYDIHKRADPADFTRATLDRILALSDRTVVMRMSALPAKAREALFTLEGNDLNTLARNLSEDELATLASYLEGLDKEPRERILRTIATSPSKMHLLASARVRDAIISSRDQSAAVAMMLEAPAAFSPRAFAEDALSAANGKVHPVLLWDKHPMGVVLLGLLAAMLVLWLGRLFRRPDSAPPPSSSGPEGPVHPAAS